MSYRNVLKDRSFARLMLSTAGGRCAQVMFDVAVVIFIVEDLHRPAVAGLTVLLATLPGLVLSPLSGSFLAGRDLTRWMAVDCAVKAAATLGIAYGASTDAGGVWLLCALALMFSLTSAFGNVALRSYIALALPPELQGPANGLDSMISGVVVMAGPAAAGVMVVTLGGRESVAVVGVLYVVAAVIAITSGRTALESGSGLSLRGAVDAVRGIVVHPVLRGLTGVYFLYQVAMGILVVALPQLVSSGFRVSTSWVGTSWSIAGLVGIAASLAAGHWISPGLERRFLIIGTAVTSVGICGLFAHSTVVWLVVVFALLGAAVGPLDVGLLGQRQAVLPETGAVATLAVSASLNMSGYPAGALVGGLLAGAGLTAQTGTALGCGLAAFVMSLLLPKNGVTPRTATAARAVQASSVMSREGASVTSEGASDGKSVHES